MTRRETNGPVEHAGHRHARLEALLRDELASLLDGELDDPALAGTRIVHVTLSVDYRHAKVFFDCTGGSPRAQVERGLERASGFLRARLADAIDLKRVPELRFVAYV